MKTTKIIALGMAAVIAFASASAMAKSKGAKLFKRKCSACHSVEPGKNKIGPSLAGVVGRKAGTAAGYTKYKAMKGATFTWNETLIAEWITNQKNFLKAHKDMVGGNRTVMSAKIKKEKQRKEIIEFLKTGK